MDIFAGLLFLIITDRFFQRIRLLGWLDRFAILGCLAEPQALPFFLCREVHLARAVGRLGIADFQRLVGLSYQNRGGFFGGSQIREGKVKGGFFLSFLDFNFRGEF